MARLDMWPETVVLHFGCDLACVVSRLFEAPVLTSSMHSSMGFRGFDQTCLRARLRWSRSPYYSLQAQALKRGRAAVRLPGLLSRVPVLPAADDGPAGFL
jgi:hypothetical protein